MRLSGYGIHLDQFYMIIDGQYVQTGDFYYSSSDADKATGNVLVVDDTPESVAKYAQNWEKLWSKAEQVSK